MSVEGRVTLNHAGFRAGECRGLREKKKVNCERRRMGRIDAHALNGEPGANWHLGARKGIITPVNEHPSICWKTRELRPPEEPVEHVRGHGIARFDFHRVEKICFFD